MSIKDLPHTSALQAYSLENSNVSLYFALQGPSPFINMKDDTEQKVSWIHFSITFLQLGGVCLFFNSITTTDSKI